MIFRPFFLYSIVVILLFSAPCKAQDGQGDLPPALAEKFKHLNIQHVSQITPELLADDHAESYGFRKSSRIYKLLLSKLSEKNPSFFINYQKLYNSSVVRHIKGEEGKKIKLTQGGKLSVEEERQMRSELEAMEQPVVPDSIEVSAEEEEAISREVRKALTPRRMSACSDSQTKRTALDDPTLDKSFRELKGLDLLILNSKAPRQSDFLATDFSEMFGHKVSVYYYDSEKPDLISLRVSASDLVCLPVRLRVNENELIVHIGQDALMNYGQVQAKKHEIHPIIKTRIDDFLR